MRFVSCQTLSVLNEFFLQASIAFINLFKVKEEDVPVSMEGYGGTMLVFRKVEQPSFWLLSVMSSENSDTAGSEYRTVYQLLGSLYTSFTRQNGPLRNSAAGGQSSESVRTRLTKKCQLFFEWFLPHAVADSGLSVPATLLPAPTPANVFGGKEEGLMKYLSLDAQSFMSVRSFVHHVTHSYVMDPQMGVLFLYNDNLVTSTLNLRSTRFLYSYVVNHVIPEAVCDEISWNKKRGASRTYWLCDRKPILLYLPDGEDGGDDMDMLQLTWTKKDIYAYRSLNGTTLVAVFDTLESGPPDARRDQERQLILDAIDLYSKQHLYNLTSIVSKSSIIALKTSSLPSSSLPDRPLFFHNPSATSSSAAGSNSDVDPGLSFLYYNEANGALKTFLSAPCFQRQTSGANTNSSTGCPAADPLAYWTVLEADWRAVYLPFKTIAARGADVPLDESPTRRIRNKTAEGGTEILAKTEQDEHWICFRRCDQRSLFATLSAHKNLNLEEVAVMCSQKFPPNSKSASNFLPFTSLFQ